MSNDKKTTPLRSRSGSNQENEGSKIDVPEAAIRKLADLLRTTDLAEIEITTGGASVRVRAKEAQAIYSIPTVASSPAPMTTTATSVAKPSTDAAAHSDLHIIRSPFIGTFYRAPSPTSPPFVEVGQSISKGQTLGIVEAMKLMNELEADVSGTIEKIFVDNATPVEFNSPLFGIRK